MGLLLLCLRQEGKDGGKEGERSGGVAGTSQDLECQAQELGCSLRAIGSHGNVLSSKVCGQISGV